MNQKESIKIFNLPVVEGLELISGSNIRNEFRRHIHKTYIVGMVTEGRRVISIDKKYAVSENETFILNPGQVHSCKSESPGHSYKILSIPVETMQLIASQISEKSENPPYFRNIRYAEVEICAKLKRLLHFSEGLKAGIELEEEYYSFLTYLIINYSVSPPKISGVGDQKESIKRVCKFISCNVSENHSLSQLSEIACLSPFHFQREFKGEMGITPHEYLSDLKISLSKKMLIESEKIADTAIMLGFFDQSHFSRVFKRTIGVSPGNFIKINKETV